jgi:hypothetical protein
MLSILNGILILRNFITLLLLFSVYSHSQQTAQSLIDQYQDALFQIKIIELGSGNKSSIGSGFQIDERGNIVTNYHVVSEYVYYPDKFRIQYLAHDGSEGELKLVNFDLVNDLALVRKVENSGQQNAFPISHKLPQQGTDLYSLGNPHDLGMIVVPGTFNGMKKNSFYQRLHFTGSINPGMSGGPVVNQQGQVVGVNVATAGNQIGFLIPLEKVQSLLGSKNQSLLTTHQFKPLIQQQLIDKPPRRLSLLPQDPWPTANLGKGRVPAQITDFISCWGGSNANEQKPLFLSVENRCQLDEQIFVHGGLQTGGLELEFEWLDGKSMGEHRFYAFYSDSITGALAGNKASQSDVTNYSCQQDKVTNIHAVTSKTVLCLRAYKEFDQLYDALFIAASLDHKQQGLISHYTLAGVTQASVQLFTQQFMDSITWQ